MESADLSMVNQYKKILSISINEDRIYMAVFQPSAKGLSLELLKMTNSGLEFPNIGLEMLEEINQLLTDIISVTGMDNIGRISLTLPADTALISQFPGKPDISPDELRNLVNLEIRQVYPQFSFDDFTSNVYHLVGRLDNVHMMLAIIIQKQDLATVKNAINILQRPISHIEISQINAHSAFIFNYPEEISKTVALIGIQKNFIDFSLLKSGRPLYYGLMSYSKKDEISEKISAEYIKAKVKYTEKLDSAYVFGSSLNKDLFMSIWESSLETGIECRRLNAFRMVFPDVDSRTKEYCQRLSHVFPGCVGGALPAYHERYKFY